MKHIALFLFAAALLASCGEQPAATATETPETAEAAVTLNFYGDTIDTDGAIHASELFALVQEHGTFEGKVKSTIHQTCMKKGCWMKVDAGNGEEIRVTFKDYGFFVPTEGVEEMEVYMDGVAYFDTTSVEALKHYAHDAGKSAEEIEAITEPEYALSFEATGVIILE